MLWIEGALALATLICGVLWYFDPPGNYEPLTVIFGVLLFFVDIYRRYISDGDNVQVVNEMPVEQLPENNEPQSSQRLSLNENVRSADFFSDRLAKAFPGQRRIKWYFGSDAIKRLSVIFSLPFTVKTENSERHPIWLYRGGTAGIDDFRIIDDDVVVIDNRELKVTKIAFVPSVTYWRQFLYIEVDGMEPTGLYASTSERRKSSIESFGYDYEEYGIYKNQLITRGEYDDGAAEIRGSLITFDEKPEIRTRYTSPYNFILAPFSSPINNSSFDHVLEAHLNEMLLVRNNDRESQVMIEELKALVDNLPAHHSLYKT